MENTLKIYRANGKNTVLLNVSRVDYTQTGDTVEVEAAIGSDDALHDQYIESFTLAKGDKGFIANSLANTVDVIKVR
jgi:hypothetical protein